ncbi:MAG: NUDIX domain-containing protein [Candidatus Hydrogenedentes bacterium]|nr:NUDIX domain-containing protein [Candidatus Hydrogenedentota bacterium]
MGNLKKILVAGGVVIDDARRVLLIERDVLRDGKLVHEVRLPKGHLNRGESHIDCAKREVGEETGYWDVEIIADLGFDVSEFDFKGQHIVRIEHYYLMKTDADRRGEPQPCGEEESIFKPVWVDLNVAKDSLTYPSEKHFVERAINYLNLISPKD